jgi:DNA (cytosine-5)-methyltransferase 1
MPKRSKQIKVIELFAWVGWFRLGLESASKAFKIVWSNQWEPATKTQDASNIYIERFGKKNHSNEDIAKVPAKIVPDYDMLVWWFPCQDYSVARTLKQAAGLEWKKGVLWWEIHRLISEKKEKPPYLLLENVDRLLKSPAKQRWRDFAIILASLSDLWYAVEWRVINAAEYGMPQRRRRVFIIGYHKTTSLYKEASKKKEVWKWIAEDGIFASAFPVLWEGFNINEFEIEWDLADITSNFNVGKKKMSPFENSWFMVSRKVFTAKLKPNYKGKHINLGDVLIKDKDVPAEFFIKKEQIEKWQYLKWAKNLKKVNKSTGIEYKYNEGAMVFPDPLNKPSRTVITGEGGPSPSRFKHVVQTKDGRLRRLTPLELERLNMFPDNHTAWATDIKRAFFMGNALVVWIIKKIWETLDSKINF